MYCGKEMAGELEYIFSEKGISFEANSPYYLCEIEGRKFHYSPKTGKWKMKGEQRNWLLSESVEDFISQAQKYLPSKSKFSKRKPNVSVHFTRRERIEPNEENDLASV